MWISRIRRAETGKFVQAREAAVHGAHVVHHLGDVARCFPAEHLGLRGQEILERALCAFDLAREHRFLSDVHVDEEVGIRQRVDGPVEPAKGAIGFRKPPLKLAVDRNSWQGREARGKEGAIA